jgi:ribosome-binding ATPase YchF (GTP1/OBG family)
MPDDQHAVDELLVIRRQEESIAQARHALTRRHVREQQRLLVSLRQSRLAAALRLRAAANRHPADEQAQETLGRIELAAVNARHRLAWLRAREDEEYQDLVAAAQRRELAELNRQRGDGVREVRKGYALREQRWAPGERRKAA